MIIEKARAEQIEEIVDISKKAFDSDITVGATEVGGPPEYDSIKWHIEMMKQGHLFTATENNNIIGGAVIFIEKINKRAYIGRIFISQNNHRKGYGTKLMQCIEKQFSDIDTFYLETPIWNIRTNNFYNKLGYQKIKKDNEFVYYKKHITEM